MKSNYLKLLIYPDANDTVSVESQSITGPPKVIIKNSD